MAVNINFWKNKKVFITGHTGFIGGWTGEYLLNLKSKIYGYSLSPSTRPNFFTALNLEKKIQKSNIADILNYKELIKAIKDAQPSIVFHMAAQPLVKESYATPLETFETNAIGTANILNAIRSVKTVKAVINITTDKCYENKEWIWPYRENDKLGGFDPYSASKACSEIITKSFKKSFFEKSQVTIATARIGNVIGGGDWAKDRLIPDFFRSFDKNTKLMIRNPNSIRPWQHVLEPISGLLTLAEKMIKFKNKYSGPWNFGPNENEVKSVSWVINYLSNKTKFKKFEIQKKNKFHEAQLLRIDSSKSRSLLNWKSKWDIENSLKNTIKWYSEYKNKNEIDKITKQQIALHMKKEIVKF